MNKNMLEIERKYLVKPEIWEVLKNKVPKEITQGYLKKSDRGSVRIRIESHPHYEKPAYAYLMSKTKVDYMSSNETVDEITVQNAEVLLIFCEKIIKKKRYLIDHNDSRGYTLPPHKVWEIDVFEHPNKGFVLAEIELKSADDEIVLPPWIDREVTGEPEYYNANM
jgi:adenylate cyclase